jgi:hypothetical protein
MLLLLLQCVLLAMAVLPHVISSASQALFKMAPTAAASSVHQETLHLKREQQRAWNSQKPVSKRIDSISCVRYNCFSSSVLCTVVLYVSSYICV